jgi:hypothetical protein
MGRKGRVARYTGALESVHRRRQRSPLGLLPVAELLWFPLSQSMLERARLWR